jgi:LPXTG-site transpeptidase (sortase) family protein
VTERVHSCFRGTALSFARPTSSANQRHRRQQFIVFLVSTGLSLLFLSSVTYYWTSIARHNSLSAVASPKNVDGAAATLSIPRINLRAELPSPAAITGDASDAAKPVPENPAMGHRSSFFNRLTELQIGDEIVVTRRSREYHYSVQSKTVVDPKNISAPQPESKEHLTLVTTYPPSDGPATQELVIVATLQKSIALVPNGERQ